jgi:hypothetical protein
MRNRFNAFSLLFQIVSALKLSPGRSGIGDIGDRMSRREKNEGGE